MFLQYKCNQNPKCPTGETFLKCNIKVQKKMSNYFKDIQRSLYIWQILHSLQCMIQE